MVEAIINNAIGIALSALIVATVVVVLGRSIWRKYIAPRVKQWRE